jgi:hypothetical protein
LLVAAVVELDQRLAMETLAVAVVPVELPIKHLQLVPARQFRTLLVLLVRQAVILEMVVMVERQVQQLQV